ncbi:hypothetical protein L873DRAFT_1793385 [Choiromyces venosus 120613-1]|uniref:Uncharacterized protein n=1 Tax=Choiromyces venosus 120613-1 TaxID=1336337 RepID=A0A3N4JIU3_9PEZI|nr:hypothetical protein L873DRAFT_1793385 [Choiromyces venosus 120613-1]
MTLYGCPREVYHPLSSRAEPTAVLFYESSDEEEEDVVGEVGNKTPPAVNMSPKSSPGRSNTSASIGTGSLVKVNGSVHEGVNGGGSASASVGKGKEVVVAPGTPPRGTAMGTGARRRIGLGLGAVVRPENTFGDRSPFRNGRGRRGKSAVKNEGAGQVGGEEEDEEAEEEAEVGRRVRIPGSFDFND